VTGLRLLSWNVRDLLGDPLAVARVLRSADADLVCLQEAPRWPGSLPRLAALARSAGLLAVAGGRASAGTAILCSARVDVLTAAATRLPVTGRLTRPRGVATAVVRLPGGPALAVASVHLPLEPDRRVQHAGRIQRLLAGSGLPAVLAGDLNEPPGGPAWQACSPLLADPWPGAGPTFPARRPTRRIDAVLAGRGVRVAAEPQWRPDTRDVLLASDHLPVLAVIDLDVEVDR
jgi:endonuclease/exonuclease/phosphatase family metal-dependent hydrolase